MIESGGEYDNFQKYTEEFCVPYNCYTLVVYDSYGDGIKRPGYYELFVDGESQFIGGAENDDNNDDYYYYNFKESHDFCLNPSFPSNSPSSIPSS